MSLSPAELEALTARLEVDGAKLHDIVQGNDTAVVATDGGNVPSLAKQLADIRTGLSNGLSATSASEITIGTGAKVFTIAANKFFSAGHIVLVVKSDDATKWMLGSVTSYVGTTLTLDVTVTNGAGTISNWVIGLSGLRGQQGIQGDTGTTTFAGLTGTPADNAALAGALAAKATPGDISTAIANLVASSPAALDTLNELAAALGDDPNFATTMTNALAGKQASNANLTALAGLALAANKMVYATGTGALALTTLSAFMRGLLGSASATAVQVNMGVRQLLLSIKTIYVSTTGSDSTGDGSVGTPYATINKAFSVISQTLDTAGFAITIKLFGGTYTDSVGVIPSWVGGGQIIISGNDALPSSVILTSSVSTGVVNVTNPGHVKVEYLKLQSTVGNCLTTKGSGSKLTVGAGINFGTCAGIQMQADAQSTLNRENSYTISGGALIHEAATGGVINTTSGITVTGVGTIAYSVRYAQAVLLGVLNNAGTTWSGGTFTGQKYFCGSGAVIFTNTGDINYFPGSTAGLTSGGQYI